MGTYLYTTLLPSAAKQKRMINSLFFFFIYILIQACLFFPDRELSFPLFFQSFLKTIGMSQITLDRIQIEVYEMLGATFEL